MFIRMSAVCRALFMLAAAAAMLAACTKATSEIEPPAVPEEASVRTEEIFDREAYKDQLTIRYFYLDGKDLMGDSFLIISPDGKTMLVDSGLPEAGTQVVDYLNKLGIDTLDIALNTHPHIDHIGGFATVAKEKEIKQFYMINLPYTKSSAYTNAMSPLEEKKVPVRTLEDGDVFQLGDQVRFEVLSPPKGELPDAVKVFSAPEINDYSMVFRMTYGERTFLFTADIYKHREIELTASPWADKLKSDMMDIPHHGSESTSSSEAFLRAVSPQIAIISQNIFQSPNLKERLEKKGTEVYTTGLHGHILLHTDGKTIQVKTEKDWEPPGKDSAGEGKET
ncbi:ComEC/Rec2 family competence protein [Paenibacillus sp. 32O-W]|uniref:ComEC/Rec2 family competence protein n=1 Tax=Paenibacillus sp. 32O-W TaxID=1695218 RepID=UPI0016429DA4|nr:MBL fold metallo-hydrolase [Paenibacillus sp. 32O-W]